MFPGKPWTFEASCCWTAGFCWLLEPVVSPGFAAGPFLLPGAPATPAPELPALVADDALGAVVCASAGASERLNASAPVPMIVFIGFSLILDEYEERRSGRHVPATSHPHGRNNFRSRFELNFDMTFRGFFNAKEAEFLMLRLSPPTRSSQGDLRRKSIAIR